MIVTLRLIVLVASIFILGTSTSSLAIGLESVRHPFHTSVAEAELNRETGRIEVALQVNAADLERVVAALADQKIPLEDEAAVTHIVDYLGDRFRIGRDETSEPSEIGWVGLETRGEIAWLYFEVISPESGFPSLNGLMVRHSVFFELQDDQINTVRFRDGDLRKAYRFSRQDPVRRLELL